MQKSENSLLTNGAAYGIMQTVDKPTAGTPNGIDWTERRKRHSTDGKPSRIEFVTLCETGRPETAVRGTHNLNQ